MNLSRTLSIFAAATVLAAPAFAASAVGTISSLKGTAGSPKSDGTSVALKVGDELHEGDVIVVPQDSALEMKLPGGGVIVFGPGTRARILSLQAGDSGVSGIDIALTRGSISGDATGNPTGSSLTVRTTAGVANLSGARFATVFEPSTITKGQFTVVAAAGSASVMPVNGFDSIPVPAGEQIVLGGRNPSPRPTPATPVALALANGGPVTSSTPPPPPSQQPLPGSQSSPGQTGESPPNVAITSPIMVPGSPNGEGQRP